MSLKKLLSSLVNAVKNLFKAGVSTAKTQGQAYLDANEDQVCAWLDAATEAAIAAIPAGAAGDQVKKYLKDKVVSELTKRISDATVRDIVSGYLSSKIDDAIDSQLQRATGNAATAIRAAVAKLKDDIRTARL